MAASKKPEASTPKFAIRLAPYASISNKLIHERASEIDPVLLAAEIREHGFATMPADVQNHLCLVLDGKVEKRGRKGKSPIEKHMEGLRAHLLYEALRDVQRGEEDVAPGAIEIHEALHDDIEDSYSPSEAIWRMVAILMHGNQGHHKKLRNLASKANSAKISSARKSAQK